MLVCAVFLASGAVACAGEDTSEEVDYCAQAALHRESCGASFVTPPICDEDSEAVARWLLGLDCETIRKIEQAEEGKADGAFCIWFGAGCVQDEPIFTGSACVTDVDCLGAGYCVENHCFAGFGSGEFESIMDGLTGTREKSGSIARILTDNEEASAVRLELMEQAAETIHLSALYMRDDAAGASTLEALVAAALRGVEVRVVLDDYGQSHWGEPASVAQMQAAGIEVIGYNPLLRWAYLRSLIGLWADQRLHEKILVVDGAHAVIGGRNVSDDYLSAGRYRDTDAYLTGPGVAGVQRIFLEVWDRIGEWERSVGCPQQLHCPLADSPPTLLDPRHFPELPMEGTAHTRAILGDPHLQEVSHAYQTILALVRAARESIYITNAYPVPPRRLRKHLRDAARRGVEVIFITNSKTSSAEPYLYYAGINYYKELIDGGIEIRHWRGPSSLHAKTMVIDGEVALVSSFNMDARSASRNTEALLQVRDHEALEALLQAFVQDLSNSDVACYKDIPLSDWAMAKASRIVEPLL